MIASLLRHSGTSLVRRYAHLSPSYLQEAVEKVSSFGKVEKEPVKTSANSRLISYGTATIFGGGDPDRTGDPRLMRTI